MSEISKQALKVDNTTSFPNNTTGYISPTILRAFNVNMIDSLVDEITYTADSGSWNTSISALQAFSSSQQPSFTGLNAFTASASSSILALSQFTQSASGRLNSLEAYTASFTTSVGIYDEGTFVNNVNQINFSGNGITASYVSGKAVVSVNFTPLNDFTQSTSATLTALGNNFNSYTASTNNSIALLNGVTGSYATTGSNIFTQNQFFEKNVSVTQSLYVGQNIYVQGGIEATYIKTIYETSSIIYSSGSNQLGDALSDTQILSGSTYVEGQLYVNKLNVTDQFALINSFTASQNITNANLNATTASLNNSVNSLNQQTASILTSIDNLNIATQSIAPLNVATASLNAFTASQLGLNGTFATTGSNTFVGQQIIDNAGLQIINQYGNITIARNAEGSGSQYAGGYVSLDAATFTNDGVYGGWGVSDSATNTNLISIAGNSYTPFGPETVGGIFGGGQNEDFSDAAIIIRTGSADMYMYKPTSFVYGVGITGSLGVRNGASISGSLRLTGSVYSNVISQSIVGSTASIDLSKANFYTVALPSTTSTNLNITNPGVGQTAMIRITSNTQASASFSANVKQPSGFSYIPSSGSGDIDVLTLASFDGTNVLVTNVTKLV